MPKKVIQNFQVELLQVLDEEGHCDDTLIPPLDEKEILNFYRWMILIRTFDEKAILFQREGRLGTYVPVRGQEAVQVGCGLALGRSDWFFPAFREGGILMIRGLPMKRLFQYWSGDERGNAIPEGIHNFPIAAPVGTHIPHAVGAAWAANFRKDPIAVLVSFGDGATSKGDFHEGLNFAGVFRLPIVFLCQNNQWALSVPRSRQSASATLAQKAIAYGFNGIQVDGNDPFAVYKSVSEGLDRARRGGGPILIECLTYRTGDHTTADDASRYRSSEEVAQWEKRDPLIRLRKYMERKNLWDKVLEKKMWKEAGEEVLLAFQEFEKTPPSDPLDFFRFLYAQPTPDLSTQMESLKRRLERNREEG